ncbi:MAG: hypothetical protein MI924_24545 [Chloroflexales bacterium]|nr:hypothetical protein [Chloroflexales bacterium]
MFAPSRRVTVAQRQIRMLGIVMPGFETHSSQFGLVSGIRQPASDLIMVVEPSSLFAPEARKGRLYIVVEADREAARSLAACQLVIRTIRKAFYDDVSFSITASLRAAIREANKLLYQQNGKAPNNQRPCVGLTCAVIKDTDLFIAQVAPAQAYVWTEDALRALPAPMMWSTAHVSVTPFIKTTAIGASLFVEPEFYRCRLQPGDALTLCSSSIARFLSREDAEQTLRFQKPSAATESLYTLCRQHQLDDAHTIIIEVLPPISPAARDAPLSPKGIGEHGRWLIRRVGDWFAGLTGEAALTFRNRDDRSGKASVDSPDALTKLPKQPQYSPNPLPRPRQLDLGDSIKQREEKKRRQQTGRYKPSGGLSSASLGEGGYQNQPLPAQRPIDLSDMPTLAASARPLRSRYQPRPFVDLTWGERLAMPFQHMGMLIEDLPRRVRARRVAPPSMPLVRSKGLSYRHQKPPFPWMFLLFLTTLIAILILYGISFSRRSAQQQAQEYLMLARQNVGLVYEAANDAEALERLDIARRSIDEIRANPHITETNPASWISFQALQSEYERLQSSIQRLSFLEDPTLVATHPLSDGRFASLILPKASPNVTDTATLDALRYMYALDGDREGARLYRIPREGGQPQLYLGPNQTVQNVLVGRLQGAAWRVDNIIAIDQNANGFGYYFRGGDDWNYSRLGSTELWAPPGRIDIESYDGNLYVWGAEPGEIVKFTSGDYASPPTLWLDPSGLDGRDLSSSVDMEIDGNIYLLQPDGQVLVFSSGRLVGEVAPESITPPITTVTRFAAIGASPEEGWFFLLDTLNERIIQMEKTSGVIIQQIQVRPDSDIRLDKLSDIIVDEDGNRIILYLVNGEMIIKADLPAPPSPFRQSNPIPTPLP